MKKHTRNKVPKNNFYDTTFHIQSAFDNVAGITGYLAGVIHMKRDVSPETIGNMKILLKDTMKHLEKSKKKTNVKLAQ